MRALRIVLFGRRGPLARPGAFFLPQKPNAHVAILRRENFTVVIVQLNLIRRVISRSPRRVSIPQLGDSSRYPSVSPFDATFHLVFRRIATLRLSAGLRLPRAPGRGEVAIPIVSSLYPSFGILLGACFRLGSLPHLRRFPRESKDAPDVC